MTLLSAATGGLEVAGAGVTRAAGDDVAAAAYPRPRMTDGMCACGAGPAAGTLDGPLPALPASRGRRDLFPLPQLRAAPQPPPGRSRTAARAAARRRHFERDCQDTISALNWMAGYKTEPPPDAIGAEHLDSMRVHDMQADVLAFVRDSIASWSLKDAPSTLPPQAAFTRLLRGRGYDQQTAAAVGLTSFDKRLVSRR